MAAAAPGRTGPRLGSVLAGVWAGVLLCIGTVATPAIFALAGADAGRVVARIFALEAPLSLGLSAVLFLIVRREARAAAAAGRGSVIGADVLLVLGALFSTVLGYYALQPMMTQARLGQDAWSFGALHTASLTCFVLKGVLVLLLAWRLTRA